MSGSGDLIKLDQDHLETVIPQPGGRVRLVNGKHRGHCGTLFAIDEARFCARVRLDDERGGGEDGGDGPLLELEYEDVCKLSAR